MARKSKTAQALEDEFDTETNENIRKPAEDADGQTYIPGAEPEKSVTNRALNRYAKEHKKLQQQIDRRRTRQKELDKMIRQEMHDNKQTFYVSGSVTVKLNNQEKLSVDAEVEDDEATEDE